MIRLLFLCCISVAWLTGCEKKEQAVSVSLVGYNHTGTEILYALNDSMSVYLSPHSGGGVACCGTLYNPEPGATVTIAWQEGARGEVLRREVVIPPFEGKVGGFRTHFLRNGDIQVFVTHLFPGHPDYPLQGEQAQLYPPGESPREKWAAARHGAPADKADVLINELRRAGATGGLSRAILQPFIAGQIEIAAGYGITDLDDLLDYMILALYTSGSFIEHPYVRERLSQPEDAHAVPFREWAKSVPHDEFEATERPLWEAPAG